MFQWTWLLHFKVSLLNIHSLTNLPQLRSKPPSKDVNVLTTMVDAIWNS